MAEVNIFECLFNILSGPKIWFLEFVLSFKKYGIYQENLFFKLGEPDTTLTEEGCHLYFWLFMV